MARHVRACVRAAARQLRTRWASARSCCCDGCARLRRPTRPTPPAASRCSWPLRPPPRRPHRQLLTSLAAWLRTALQLRTARELTCALAPVGCSVQVPTFHLSQEDIEGGFEAFVERVEESLARAGACKLVPPASWTPRKAGYQSLRLHVPSPITQNASGGRGLWRHYNTVGKGVTIQVTPRGLRATGSAAKAWPGTMLRRLRRRC